MVVLCPIQSRAGGKALTSSFVWKGPLAWQCGGLGGKLAEDPFTLGAVGLDVRRSACGEKRRLESRGWEGK